MAIRGGPHNEDSPQRKYIHDDEYNYDVLEKVEDAVSDINRNRFAALRNNIERKHFKNLRKIEPDEKYNKKRDPYFMQNSNVADYQHRHHYSQAKEFIVSDIKRNLSVPDEALKKHKLKSHSLNLLRGRGYPNSLSYSVSRVLKQSSPSESYYRKPCFDQNSQRIKSMIKNDKLDDLPALSPRHNQTSEPVLDFASVSGSGLLLWSMKEHLKYLHSTDPERWTPLELSTAFPIPPDDIVKLLKSKWKPADEKELLEHDRKVVERWRKLTCGKLGSHSLVLAAVTKRVQTACAAATSSLVPGVDDSALHLFDRLIFEPLCPEDVNVQNFPRPKAKAPLYGFYSDMVTDYELLLKKLKNKELQKSKEKSCEDDSHMSSSVDILSLINPPVYREHMVSVLVPPLREFLNTANHLQPVDESVDGSGRAPRNMPRGKRASRLQRLRVKLNSLYPDSEHGSANYPVEDDKLRTLCADYTISKTATSACSDGLFNPSAFDALRKDDLESSVNLTGVIQAETGITSKRTESDNIYSERNFISHRASKRTPSDQSGKSNSRNKNSISTEQVKYMQQKKKSSQPLLTFDEFMRRRKE